MRVARQTKARNSTKTGTREPSRQKLPLSSAPRSVGRAHERRAYVRARLPLPLCVCRVAGQASSEPPSLRLRDISSSGAFFLYPEKIEPGTPLALEVSLLEERPRHRAVRMCVDAHVVRAEDRSREGWHGLAVAFDDIRYVRVGHFNAPPLQPVALPAS